MSETPFHRFVKPFADCCSEGFLWRCWGWSLASIPAWTLPFWLVDLRILEPLIGPVITPLLFTSFLAHGLFKFVLEAKLRGVLTRSKFIPFTNDAQENIADANWTKNGF